MFIQKEGDMTTLTSHSLPLIPLRSSISLFSKRFNVNDEICPINGVESALPRNLIRLPLSPKEEQEMSPQNCYASENSQSNSICDIDTRLMNNSEPRSSSASSHKGNDNMHNDDDYMNYASDDSELSVGKEIVDNAHNSRRSINNLNDGKMCSSSVATVSAAAFRMDDISSLDRISYYQTTKHPNVVRPSPTRQEEFLRKTHLYAEEIMKHQINFMTVTKGLNISPMSPISPISPIRLGDNNQTQYNYPLPHQNSLSPIHNNAATNKPLKIGFDCLQAYANDNDLSKKWSVIEDRNARSPEGTNFREIHSHLNAISKITSALGRETNIRLQMASPICTASRESSQSPPTSNSTTNMRQMLHNNFNETNLKFSIDNILKPSFGRRITDPLLKRQKPMRKSAASHRTSITNSDRINITTASIDSMTNLRLSMPTNNKQSMDQTTAPKLLNQLSNPMNSNGSSKESITTSATDKSSTTSSQSAVNSPTTDANSKGAIAWPAWVYCTRYSDRPSSGKNLTAYSCRTSIITIYTSYLIMIMSIFRLFV